MVKSELVSRDEIRAFTMPRPVLGQPVLWRAVKGREAEIAYVYRIGTRNVHLATATKGSKEAVRHEDDPKLRLNADQREMGAWDFTDYDKQQQVEKAELLARIDSLERQIAGLITGRAKTKEPAREQELAPAAASRHTGDTELDSMSYTELTNMAKKLEVYNDAVSASPGRVSSSTLREFIARKRDAKSSE